MMIIRRSMQQPQQQIQPRGTVSSSSSSILFLFLLISSFILSISLVQLQVIPQQRLPFVTTTAATFVHSFQLPHVVQQQRRKQYVSDNIYHQYHRKRSIQRIKMVKQPQPQQDDEEKVGGNNLNNNELSRVETDTVVVTAQALAPTTTTTITAASTTVTTNIEQSTILLLEHVNLNIPSQYHAIHFYIQLLGCHYDPRRFQNVVIQKSGTIWANAGRSQFHLPFGVHPQCIPGKIGIRIHASHWSAFQHRVKMAMMTLPSQQPQQQVVVELSKINMEQQEQDSTTLIAATSTACSNNNKNDHNYGNIIKAVTNGHDRYQNEYIEITDQYNNVFYCRPTPSSSRAASENNIEEQLQLQNFPIQPIVTRDDPKYIQLYGQDVLDNYIPSTTDTTTTTGASTTSCCVGIDFIEFDCPIGTAEKIAIFYNTCFDVEVNVVDQQPDDDSNDDSTNRKNNKKNRPTKQLKMAIIAIGTIDIDTGRTDQSLIFREVENYDTTATRRIQQQLLSSDVDLDNSENQFHIAIYVGETIPDFQQAYRNCDTCDLIYINPRFADKADTLDLATNVYHQFRIQHIIDIESSDGAVIMELEHEIRSRHHEAWIGSGSRSSSE